MHMASGSKLRSSNRRRPNSRTRQHLRTSQLLNNLKVNSYSKKLVTRTSIHTTLCSSRYLGAKTRLSLKWFLPLCRQQMSDRNQWIRKKVGRHRTVMPEQITMLQPEHNKRTSRISIETAARIEDLTFSSMILTF